MKIPNSLDIKILSCKILLKTQLCDFEWEVVVILNGSIHCDFKSELVMILNGAGVNWRTNGEIFNYKYLLENWIPTNCTIDVWTEQTCFLLTSAYYVFEIT